jgi:hypothetical protein
VDYLKFIVKKCKGAVLCLDGSIRKPFDTDHPMAFRFFNVTGAFNGEPQVWGVDDERQGNGLSAAWRRRGDPCTPS